MSFIEDARNKARNVKHSIKHGYEKVLNLINVFSAWWEGSIMLPFSVIAYILFGILYFLSPIDLIPDFIPCIGYLDDIAVITFVTVKVSFYISVVVALRKYREKNDSSGREFSRRENLNYRKRNGRIGQQQNGMIKDEIEEVIEEGIEERIEDEMEDAMEEKIENDDNDEILCVICLEKKKEILFEPCHHVCVCYEHSQILNICRCKIKLKKKVYL